MWRYLPYISILTFVETCSAKLCCSVWIGNITSQKINFKTTDTCIQRTVIAWRRLTLNWPNNSLISTFNEATMKLKIAARIISSSIIWCTEYPQWTPAGWYIRRNTECFFIHFRWSPKSCSMSRASILIVIVIWQSMKWFPRFPWRIKLHRRSFDRIKNEGSGWA